MLADKWTAKSAHRFTKSANTPAKKKKWSHIAEGLRKKGEDEGKAIRIANAAVGDRFWDGDFFLRREFNDWLDRKTKKYNSKGQEEGYFETEEGDSASVGDAKKKAEAKPIIGRSKCPECDGKGVEHGRRRPWRRQGFERCVPSSRRGWRGKDRANHTLQAQTQAHHQRGSQRRRRQSCADCR